ncbi:hypothetical protein D3C76_1867000 [compost metagenome]
MQPADFFCRRVMRDDNDVTVTLVQFAENPAFRTVIDKNDTFFGSRAAVYVRRRSPGNLVAQFLDAG